MKRIRSALAILIAALLLVSALPITALAAETELADDAAGMSVIDVSSAAQLKAAMEQNSSVPIKINVTADIMEYVTDRTAYGTESYQSVWCTLGSGPKVLELNGHFVTLSNAHVAEYAYAGDSNKIHSRNALTLFHIPSVASLVVNGKDSSGKEGKLDFGGVVLDKVRAWDVRNVFSVYSGSLTINSGRITAGEGMGSAGHERTYTNKSGTYIMQVSGNVIKADGHARITINGGTLEARGWEVSGVSNTALWTKCATISLGSHDVQLNINDGVFKGKRAANVFNMGVGAYGSTGKLNIYSGEFYIDHYGNVSEGEYYGSGTSGNYTCPVNQIGQLGIVKSFRLREHSLFEYYSNSWNIWTNANLAAGDISTVKNENTRIVPMPSNYCYKNTMSDLKFYDGSGNRITVLDWNKESSVELATSAAELYFPKAMDEYNKGIEQKLDSLTLTIYDQTETKVGGPYSLSLSGFTKMTYSGKIDLASLKASIKALLKEGESYRLEFTATEGWSSAHSFSIPHTGSVFVSIDEPAALMSAGLTVTQPAVGNYPDNNPVPTEPGKYTISFQYWYNETDYKKMTASDKFESGKKYYIYVQFVPASGNSFSDDTVYYVNGKKGILNSAGRWGYVKGVFDFGYTGTVTLLTEARATVTAPVAGAHPDFMPISAEPEKYGVTVERWYPTGSSGWNNPLGPDDTFVEGKSYYCRIKFTATEAYSMDYRTTKCYLNDTACSGLYTYGTKTVGYDMVFSNTPVPTYMVRGVIHSHLMEPESGVRTCLYPVGMTEKDGQIFTYWNESNVNTNTAFAFDPVKEGDYVLRIEKNGHKPYEKTLHVDKKLVLIIDLELADAEGEYTVGDINLDNSVTNKDALILDRKLAKWKGYDDKITVKTVADLNRDTNITNKDSLILNRYLAKWKGYEQYIIKVNA